MEDTLLIGDHILGTRYHGSTPVLGDIIVFRYPVDRRQTFVKRVIGIPGDRIKIVDKRLFRNGTPLDEPYVRHVFPQVEPYRDMFPSDPSGPVFASGRQMLVRNVVNGEVVVPEGKYFVLGDNRDNSLDSRYWGFVGTGDILGKPLLVLYSEDLTTEDAVKNDVFRFTWGRVRWNRFFKIL